MCFVTVTNMKRAVLALFLTIFTVSVVGRSVVRTVDWAAQRAHDFGRGAPDRASARMGEARKHTQWQVHTKSLQDTSMAISFVRSTDPLLTETTYHHALISLISAQNEKILSSRAPPASI